MWQTELEVCQIEKNRQTKWYFMRTGVQYVPSCYSLNGRRVAGTAPKWIRITNGLNDRMSLMCSWYVVARGLFYIKIKGAEALAFVHWKKCCEIAHLGLTFLWSSQLRFFRLEVVHFGSALVCSTVSDPVRNEDLIRPISIHSGYSIETPPHWTTSRFLAHWCQRLCQLDGAVEMLPEPDQGGNIWSPDPCMSIFYAE